MIRKWIVVEPTGNSAPKGCLLALPGRNIPGDVMEGFCHAIGLDKSLLVVLEPQNLQWYPAPQGPTNQYAATNGLAESGRKMDAAIQKIERDWGIRRDRVAIVGFSAGAVLALHMVATSATPFAGIVSLAGAILEPSKLPTAPTKTPVLIQHNRDDECFKWDERYVPMKKALVDRGYQLYLCERPDGNHTVCIADAKLCNKFLRDYLGYAPEKKKAAAEEKSGAD